MSNRTTRRQFLGRSSAGLVLAGAGYFSSRGARAGRAANERLNIGCIGTANQARYSIDSVKASENVAALCDVDDRLLGRAREEFPRAQAYQDFRRLLDQPDLDAVIVCTPDHIHAPASMGAIVRGKHVYCEKPLTHTVAEARALAQAAARHKVATQMGTQIHAEDNYRRVVEIVQSGAIGEVREVHTWAGRSWGGGERPSETPEVPAHLHWDLWLGPARARPYHPCYLPANWRKWWDFGGGNLADMACHHMDLPFWALGLRHPSKVSAEGPPVHPETCPLGLVVRYEFPARESQPAVRLTWYDGERIPPQIHGFPTGGGGNVFVGSKGLLRADYGSWTIGPARDFAGFEPPAPTIAKSPGHHNEWLAACKTGSPTLCNFDYSGALTEAVLLGNVAYRTGQELHWDPQSLKATNCPAADQYLRREYRQGWKLEG
jgi:predicted dehydrogenase